MQRNVLFTILFVCTLGLTQIVNGISVINGTYEIKSTSLVDVVVSTVFVEFTTDEPVMIPNGVTCPVYNCPTVAEVPPDCACDYTSLNGYCGDPLPGFACSCTNQQLCNATTNPWVDLPLNTRISARAGVGKFLNYRFLLEDGCEGFVVRLYPVWGTPFLYINRNGLSDPRSDPLGAVTNSQRMYFYNLCPTESEHNAGTYFVSVLAALTDAEFELEVTTQKAPILSETPTASDCSSLALDSDTFCIDDSAPGKYSCLSAFNHFVYEIHDCQRLSISVKAITPGTDIDLYMSMEDWYGFQYSDWSSYNTGDELLFLSVCPPTGQNTAFLYIVVNCFIEVPNVVNNFSLVVTSLSDWNYRPITDFPPYSAPWEIAGAGRLIVSTAEDVTDPDNWKLCENWRFTCTEFVFVYPGEDMNPFWPIPPTIKNMIQFRYVQLPILTPPPKNNTISLLLFISVAEDVTGSTVFPETNIDTFGVEFLGRLTNSNGEGLTGLVKPTQITRDCDYPAFESANQLVLDVIDALDETSETVELVSLQFQLGVLMYKNDWYPCNVFLTSLYQTESIVTQVLTRACVTEMADPLWYTDPCCWSVEKWNTPCVPRLVYADVTQYNSIQDKMVSNQCGSSECVETYLSDYQDFLQDQHTEEDLCSSNLASGQQNSTMSYENYRYCKDLVWGSLAVCYEDTDCIFYGTGSSYTFSCDLTSHRCIVPPAAQEQLFAICLLVTMTQYQLLYVQEQFALPGDPLSLEFVEAYIAALRTHTDCVSPIGLDTGARNHYQLVVYDVNCAITNECPDLECDDTSCALPEDSCLTWCEAKSWKPINSSQQLCEQEVYCNWNSTLCDGLTLSQCESVCSGANFCGWCENGQDCVEFPSINNPATCNATTICIFANGSYALNIDPAVCESSYAQCSQKCPMTCSSQSSSTGYRCYDTTISSGTCATRGGSWDSGLSTCFYPSANSSASCSTYNATFANCGDLTMSSCYECQTNPSLCSLNQVIMQCYIQTDRECANEAECYWAGSCSDRELLFDLDAGLVGACVVARSVSTNFFLYPYCEPPRVAFPNGCIDYSMNKSSCYGYWWEPSTTYAQCTANSGCLDVYDEFFQVGLQFAFSPKSYSDCISPFNAGGTWQTFFEWTWAGWTNATSRNLTWVPRKAEPRNQWNTSIDFSLAWDTYFEGAVSKSALDAKSATLCASSRLQQTIQTVTCDCAENAATDSALCYKAESAAVPVAQGLPCSGVNTTVVSPSSIITFFPNSVNLTCVDVAVSEISQLQFQNTEQATLSANFANFKTVDEFGFNNKHGVVVGTLLGNGVELLASGNITGVLLCITLRSTDKQGFPTFDFAATNSKYDELTPRELKGVRVSDSVMCCEIDLVEGEKAAYFPIARDDNWDTNTSFFDPATEGLSYTLAVLFLVVSIAALANLAHDGWVAISTRHNVDIQFYVVLFIFFFNFVRSIYFFIVPTGVSSLTVDFLMVVLPTFFYFTAFTLVILVWAVVCIKPLTQSVGEYMKYVRISAGILNGILYVFWIVIVSIFASLQNQPADSPCGARVAESDNSNKLQRVVSVIYTTVIALVSLAIGVGFLYFGGRLYWQARQSGRKTNQRKIFQVAFICSISFILHCIFLFVIIGLSEPVVAFSFAGLLITEIAPSLFIIITFSKLHPQKMKSGSSKSTQASEMRAGNSSNVASY